jgi:hypothetical protein
MVLPYQSALDNWNRYTADPAAPPVQEGALPGLPPTSPEPHLLLAQAVPGAEAPPVDTTAAVPGASVPGDLGKGPLPSSFTPMVENAAAERKEEMGAGLEFSAAAPKLKLEAMGAPARGITMDDAAYAMRKSGMIMDPRAMRQSYEFVLGNPELKALAEQHANETGLKSFGETAEGQKRIAEGERGGRPIPKPAVPEPLPPSSTEIDISPQDKMRVARAQARQAAGGFGYNPVGVSAEGIPTYDAERDLATTRAAAEEQKVAVQGLADVQAKTSRDTADIYRGAIEDIQKTHDDSIQRQSAIQQDVQKQDQAYQQSLKDLQGMEIDTGRTLRNPFMALIALAGGVVGGAYGAMSGTHKNQFLDTLNQVIERDISGQKAGIEKKRADVAAQYNLLGYFRQKLGDERQAENAVKQFRLEQAKLNIDKMAAENGSPEAQARSEQTKALIDKEMATNQQNMHQFQYSTAVSAYNTRKQIEMFGAGQANQAAMFNAQASAATGGEPPLPKAENVEKSMQNVMRLGPKEYIKVSGGPEEVGKVRTMATATDQMKRIMNRMEEALQKGTYLGGQGKRAYESDLAQLTAAWGHAEHLGALDKGLQELAEKKFGDPSALGDWLGNVREKLEAAKRAADDATNFELSKYHVARGNVYMSMTDNGRWMHEFQASPELFDRPYGTNTPARAGEVETGEREK